MPTNEDDIEPLPPILERQVGTVFPYRGTEEHGVKGDAPTLTDEEHYYSGRPVEYVEPEKEPEPIPVRVVTSGGNELAAFRVSRSQAPVGSSVPLLGRSDQRVSVKVRNMSPDTILYVSDNMGASAFTSFPIAAGATEEFKGTQPIYATSGGVNPVDVALLVTYVAET